MRPWTKACPLLGGVAAAVDVDHAAAGGAGVGDAHLGEAVLADGGEGGGFAFAVAADEAGVAQADELALVVGRDGDAVVVEVDDESVHLGHAAEIVRGSPCGGAGAPGPRCSRG